MSPPSDYPSAYPPANPPPVPDGAVDAVKAFLRLDHDQDDDALRSFLASAMVLCAGFTGRVLIRQDYSEPVARSRDWQKLRHQPVQAITAVEAVTVDGGSTALAAEDHAIDIDSSGTGWVKILAVNRASRFRVTYQAGLAAEWADLPANLRQGIIRLAGHLHAHRDAPDAAGPPRAVTALWQPHRRVRMT